MLNSNECIVQFIFVQTSKNRCSVLKNDNEVHKQWTNTLGKQNKVRSHCSKNYCCKITTSNLFPTIHSNTNRDSDNFNLDGIENEIMAKLVILSRNNG